MTLGADLTIRPSRCLAGAVMLMNVLTCAGLILWLVEIRRGATGFEFSMAIGLVCCVGLGFGFLSLVWWRTFRRIRRLVVSADGQGVLIAQSVAPRAIEGSGDSLSFSQPVQALLIWPGIMLLRTAPEAIEGRVRGFWQYGGSPVVVLRDSLIAAEYRRLAIWMLWQRRKGSAIAPSQPVN